MITNKLNSTSAFVVALSFLQPLPGLAQAKSKTAVSIPTEALDSTVEAFEKTLVCVKDFKGSPMDAEEACLDELKPVDFTCDPALLEPVETAKGSSPEIIAERVIRAANTEACTTEETEASAEVKTTQEAGMAADVKAQEDAGAPAEADAKVAAEVKSAEAAQADAKAQDEADAAVVKEAESAAKAEATVDKAEDKADAKAGRPYRAGRRPDGRLAEIRNFPALRPLSRIATQYAAGQRTKPPPRCWIRGAERPRPAISGRSCAMIGAGAGHCRQGSCSITDRGEVASMLRRSCRVFLN